MKYSNMGKIDCNIGEVHDRDKNILIIKSIHNKTLLFFLQKP